MSSKRLLGLVLDRSGSMAAIWDEASSAFDSFVEEWQEKDPDMRIVVTTFNHNVTTREVQQIKDVDGLDVSPDGLTALYDAVSHTINAVEDADEEGPADKVVVAVITDGMENASKEIIDKHVMARIIKNKEEDGWEMLYLGVAADQWGAEQHFAQAAGSGYSATYTHTAAASAKGMSASYRTVTESLSDDDENES